MQDQALGMLAKERARLEPQMQALEKHLNDLKGNSAAMCHYVTVEEKVKYDFSRHH